VAGLSFPRGGRGELRRGLHRDPPSLSLLLLSSHFEVPFSLPPREAEEAAEGGKSREEGGVGPGRGGKPREEKEGGVGPGRGGSKPREEREGGVGPGRGERRAGE
jgi:hypothetical protein